MFTILLALNGIRKRPQAIYRQTEDVSVVERHGLRINPRIIYTFTVVSGLVTILLDLMIYGSSLCHRSRG